MTWTACGLAAALMILPGAAASTEPLAPASAAGAATAHVTPDGADTGPAAAFRQQRGQALPLDLMFTDESGRSRILREFFGKMPVVMVFGYYHCPRLCSTVMDGVLQSVQGVDLPHAIVGVGIDPGETPEDAARKHAAYLGAGAGTDTLHLLTGSQGNIARLARAAGFDYRYDDASGQYDHPAGFLIATPDGHISRYFTGLRFERRDVRLALIEASGNRIGPVSERILLLCSHYDPVQGRYSWAVITLLRFAGLASVLLLAGGVWMLRRRKGAGS